MKVHSIKGTSDILSPEVDKWKNIEELAHSTFTSYGYSEIRTPIIEHTGLFTKSIGTSTDIVKKEMFTFKDKGKRDIALRPEETASVVRAYLEHKMHKKTKLAKLYYIGPMFRSERPQAGRMRQFHQMGVEAIGSYDAYLDAEIITLMQNITSRIGLKNIQILLNSLGCLKDRQKYKKILRQKLKQNLSSLCKDCRQRYKTNVLRILDCKNKSCQKIIQKLPSPLDYLCTECKSHFKKVKELLKSMNIPYVIEPRLVRGLDYYTRTTFELIHSQLGAKNTICAGGRYDNLVSSFGGPDTGACGFAFGMERLFLAMEKEKIETAEKKKDSIYIALANKEVKDKVFLLINKIRNQDITAFMDYQDKSLKAQLRRANKLNCKFVIIVGDEELKKGQLALKDMRAHTQEEIDKNDIITLLKQKLS